jgi:hypothetical protein
MKSYKIQIQDVPKVVRIQADDKPDTIADAGVFWLEFKRDDKAVARFPTGRVLGWWERNK